jgi:DUF1680 family protein
MNDPKNHPLAVLAPVLCLCVWLAMTSGVEAEDIPTPLMQPFALSDVRLLDGPCKTAMQLDEKYLLSLEPDRLLAGFRDNAGLPAKAQKYGGWESLGVEGHSLGHYLSACSMMYATTGDQQLLDRVNYCIDQLHECQSAVDDGFLGGLPHGRELFAQIAKGDLGTNGGFDLHGAWVPWYTQHKLFAGLRDAWLYTGNETARSEMIKLGDWAAGVCQHLTDDQMQHMLSVEHGGMNETLADLYAITSDKKYLDLARRFYHRAILDPLADGKDDLTGKHANTQIPKVIGCARIYELTGDERFKTIADTFWNAVVQHRSFVTGSNSDREHFFPIGLEAAKLGPEDGETCNVYNMLKLTSHLARWTGQSSYYDYYERALFNHILGSIDPDTGMTTYFQALQPGRFKVYGTPTNSFWCCTGTGMENHERYGADIYTHFADNSAICVNLFIASELNWKQKGVTLRQETGFPNTDSTCLIFHLQQPTRLVLKVRVPSWAEKGLLIDGVSKTPNADGYADVERTWSDGDSVIVTFPMSLHVHKAIDDSTMVAFMYGPIVLAAELGRQDFPPTDNVRDQSMLHNIPIPTVPVIVSDQPISTWLQPVDEHPLRFKTTGVGRPTDLTFKPFAEIAHERYAVYLHLFSKAEFNQRQAELAIKQKAEQELAARTVDEITFGEQQPEKDHNVQSTSSRTGRHQDRPWRDATSGGSFSATLKARPGIDQTLRCTYWGSDVGRSFDIFVNQKLLATQTLDNAHPDQFFDVDYALPAAAVGDSGHITVEFRSHRNSIAGGVFHLMVLLNGKQPDTRP